MDRARDPFLEQLRDEIEVLGLSVLTLHEAGPFETLARGHSAVAALRMVPSRKGVEIWMADELSGRSLLRQLVVDERRGGPDQGLVALQTVELLRTSLFSPPGLVGAASPKAFQSQRSQGASGGSRKCT